MFRHLLDLKSSPPSPGGIREVWRIAAPIIISMASLTIMQFCDRIFLARYSSVALRAALPAGALAFTLTTFFQSLAGFTGTFVAQYHGARRKLECTRSTEQGIWLALLSWPLGMALIPVGYGVLGMARHAPDVYEAEKIYLLISMLGCGVFSLNNAISGFFSGRGDTRTPMAVNMAASAANIVLDYAMIFGKWGFPEWGIAGAAIATITSCGLGVLLLLAIYWRKRFREEYATWPLRRPARAYMGPLLRYGIPNAIHAVQDIGAFALFVVLLGRLPDADVAASTIAFSINNIAFMPLLGMGMASTILVGQYQGARNSAIAQKVGYSALKVGWGFMAVLALSFLLFPRMYLSLFTGDAEGLVSLDEVIDKGRWLLVMMGVWGMVDVINIVIAGALKGAGDTRFTLLYALVMVWLIWMPGEFLLVLYFNVGLIPAWVYMTLFTFLFAVGYGLRWRWGCWKRIEMIQSGQRAEPVPEAEGV
ncbi:MAG: MATE family efflux transporter [Verrucomicrobiota bacterium]|jgi:MATE family multidrug resistance protein|nr:MATE family efflux transporter [Verrucomicrobiota bacterium]